MRENIIAYLAAAIVMAGLDYVWLTLAADPVYHRALGAVMAERPNMVAAVAFYVLYVLGVVIFAVRPGLVSGAWQTGLLYGALFGLFAYGTYDLTNLATLKLWSLKVSLIDMAWGTLLTSTVAAVSIAVTLAFEK